MPLEIRRKEGETWKEAAKRYAARNGLEGEVEMFFDLEIKKGVPEGQAAWNACYEWDVLDFVEVADDA